MSASPSDLGVAPSAAHACSGGPARDADLGRARGAWQAWAAAFLVVAVTLLAWRGLLSAELFWDDYNLIDAAAREDFATSFHVHGPGFFESGSQDAYFRPLWRWTVELIETLGGDGPRPWFATALALHVLVVLTVFALGLRWTERPWLSAAGACAFALAPAPAQAVAWSAAATNVLPCTLLLLVAGAALWDWIEHGRARALVVAGGALVLSFGFREAGYQFLPLTLTLALFVRPFRERWRGALVAALVAGGVVVLHYAFCNHVEAGETPQAVARAALRGTAVVVRDLVGAGAGVSNGVALASAGAVLGVALWFARARTRFVLVWAVCALFPYVAKFPASRFQYLVNAPLWLAATLLAADAGERFARARWMRVAGVVWLAGLAASNATRLPGARAEYVEAGRICRVARESLERMDFRGKHTVAVDVVPRDLENALATMLRHLGVQREQIVRLEVLRQPPFLLYGRGLDQLQGDGVAVLVWQPDAGRYRMTDLAGLVRGFVPLPFLALRHRARVVADPAEATRAMVAGEVDLAREVVLYAEPSPPLAPAETDGGRCQVVGQRGPRIVVEVESDADGYLVLHVLGRARAREAVLVDGVAAPLVRADGPFYAVRIPAGRHEVLVSALVLTWSGGSTEE